MAIPVTCPNCQASYSLADTLLGKKVRCKNCQGVISVDGSASAPPAPKPAPAPAPISAGPPPARPPLPTPPPPTAVRPPAPPAGAPRPLAPATQLSPAKRQRPVAQTRSGGGILLGSLIGL